MQNNSNFFSCLALVLIVATLAACGEATRDESDLFPNIPRSLRPVVLITVDTTRADRIGTFNGLAGTQSTPTPNIDRFGRWGIAFDRAYAVAPITAVAHSSILTGLYPPQHGVRTNGLQRLPSEAQTMAEMLRDQGYRTGAFVSASVLDQRYGLDQGFEIYDDTLAPTTNSRRAVPDRRAENTIDAALAWLEQVDDTENFFLWVHLYDPHAPYSPPEPWASRFASNPYDGEISYMDRQIGRLGKHPRIADQDTIVTLLADHAESLGEHGESTHGLLTFDSTLRIPWILRLPEPVNLPDKAPPILRRTATPVSQVDLLPTIFDALGLVAPKSLAGKSLLRAVEIEQPEAEVGTPRQGLKPRQLYAESHLPYYSYGWGRLETILSPPFKLHQNLDAQRAGEEGEAGELLLFDLFRDPRELSDLANQSPSTVSDLERDLRELRENVGTALRPEELSLDEDARERLRALGYLARPMPEGVTEVSRQSPWQVIHLHRDLERGRLMMEQGLFAEADSIFRGLLERDSNNLGARMELARSLAARRDFAGAEAVLRQALQRSSHDPYLLALLARVESSQGEVEGAAQLYREALRASPGIASIRVQLATLLLRQQKIEAARLVLDQGLALRSNDATLVAAKVRLFTLREDPHQAITDLRRVTDEGPGAAEVAFALGRAHEMLGEVGPALAAFERGLNRDPGNAELHGAVGLLISERMSVTSQEFSPARASFHLSEALRLAPGRRSEWNLALARALQEQEGQGSANARTQLQLVASEPAANPAEWNNQGLAHYRLGDIDAALAAFREATDSPDPKTAADAWNNLALIALDREQFAEAELHAQRSVALSEPLVAVDLPRAQDRVALAESLANLGIALQSGGEPSKAIKAFERAHEVAPDHWPATLNLAIALRLGGERRRAINLIQPWSRQSPLPPGLEEELEHYRRNADRPSETPGS